MILVSVVAAIADLDSSGRIAQCTVHGATEAMQDSNFQHPVHVRRPQMVSLEVPTTTYAHVYIDQVLAHA